MAARISMGRGSRACRAISSMPKQVPVERDAPRQARPRPSDQLTANSCECSLPTDDARQERRSLRHPRFDGHQDLGGPGPAARVSDRAANRTDQQESACTLNQGTLYPALLKLEQMGWISSKWGTSESGRRVRIYALTRAGRKQLHNEEAQWRRAAVSLNAS